MIISFVVAAGFSLASPCPPTAASCACSDVAPFMRAPADSNVVRMVRSMSDSEKRVALRSSDPEMRRASLRAIASDHPETEIAALLAAATDPSCDVAVAALDILGRVNDSRVTGEIVRAASSERCRVHEAAMWALRERNGPGVAEALLVGIADDDSRIRSAAAESLGYQHGVRVVDALPVERETRASTFARHRSNHSAAFATDADLPRCSPPRRIRTSMSGSPLRKLSGGCNDSSSCHAAGAQHSRGYDALHVGRAAA